MLLYAYFFQGPLGTPSQIVIYAQSEEEARAILKKWFELTDAKLLKRENW